MASTSVKVPMIQKERKSMGKRRRRMGWWVEEEDHEDERVSSRPARVITALALEMNE